MPAVELLVEEEASVAGVFVLEEDGEKMAGMREGVDGRIVRRG